MKRFLLTSALAVTLAIPASAEYHHFPDNDRTPEYQDWDHMVRYRLIDSEKKTVSFTSLNPDRNNPACMHGDVTVPSTVNCTFTLWDVEGNPEITDNFTVVQIEEDAFSSLDITSVTIPATIEAIGACSFRDVNTLTSLIFEESDKPLELYRGFNEWAASPITNLTINRSIITKEWELNGWIKDEGKNFLPVSNENVTVTIGPKVKTLGAELFKNVPNVVRTNLSNWQTWMEDVELGDIYSNPYREGKSELYVGGLRFTTVEIPEGTESLSDYKFAGLNFEGELTLPSSLKHIGDWTFYNNKDLYYITFPEGLESIGAHAFDGCETLRIDGLPANVKEIGEYAFTGCDLITSITLPEGIETLGEGAFCRMDGLQKAVLFSGLTELPARLFQECASLTNVYLPKQLISIGDRAFAYCPKLEDVTLPQTLEKIGMAAFCMSWDTDGSNGMIVDYDFENALDTDPFQMAIPIRQNNLTSIQFPASLREIGGFAFFGSELVTLEMNEGLESIGAYAFFNTTKLRDLKLPSTLKNIGTGAFGIGYYEENFLTDVTIPASIAEIGKGAFIYRILGQLNIGGSATTLAERSCGHPSILNIGESVKSIDPKAFAVTGTYHNPDHRLRLIRMQSVTPPSVSAAFDIAETDYDKILLIVPTGSKATYQRNPRWEKFTTVEESESDIMVHVTGEAPISEEIRIQSGLMPSRVAKMKVTGTLSETDFRLIRENMQSLYSLDLSAISNTEIPNDGLKGMTLLTDIQLPAGTTRIGQSAFEGNTLMDTPALPESVTEIAGFAFSKCSRLSITKLPDALRKIFGGFNFADCKSLRTLTAGENLITIQGETEMEAMGVSNMFGGCSLLEFVDFSKTKIKEIPNTAFSDCTNLQEIALPATLESIGYLSFANTSLKSIALPEAMTFIGSNAFAATDLRTVNIPGKVTKIYESTFKDCPRLVSVSFPTSLTEIGTTVFENSLKLAAISCAAIDAPAAESGAFTGIRSAKCSLTVPSQSFRSYLNAPQWGMFSELFNRIEVEVPDDADVTNVPEEEYQEIAEEERLAEEVETPAEDENENPASVRRRLRLAARASHADGTGYAQLFNGATLSTSSEGKGTRIFVNMKHGATLKSVLYNGVDMTDKMEGNSLLLPSGSNGTLKIVSNNDGVGIDYVESASPADAFCEVYDLQGRRAFSGQRNEVENVLSSGIYIVKTNGKTEKIVIR